MHTLAAQKSNLAGPIRTGQCKPAGRDGQAARRRPKARQNCNPTQETEHKEWRPRTETSQCANLHDDAASGGTADGDVEENLGVNHLGKLEPKESERVPERSTGRKQAERPLAPWWPALRMPLALCRPRPWSADQGLVRSMKRLDRNAKRRAEAPKNPGQNKKKTPPPSHPQWHLQGTLRAKYLGEARRREGLLEGVRAARG